MSESGRPGQFAHPGPRQFRTCRIPASGSSAHGFTASRGPQSGLTPAPLSVGVSLRRCWGSMSPSSFPPAVPCSDAPFPPQGPVGSVPLLPRYYEAFRLPDDPPARLRCLRRRGTTATRLSLPWRSGAHPPRARVVHRLPQPATRRGVVRASQVPGEPSCGRALLSDPGETPGPGLLRPWAAAFRYSYGVGSRDDSILSGLNHTAHPLAVYASQPGLPRHHARLASGWWPPLPDGV